MVLIGLSYQKKQKWNLVIKVPAVEESTVYELQDQRQHGYFFSKHVWSIRTTHLISEINIHSAKLCTCSRQNVCFFWQTSALHFHLDPVQSC